MKIDVTGLLDNTISRLSLDFEEKLEGFDFSGDHIRFNKPVKFNGALIKDGKFIVLTGCLEANLIASCARCLSDVEYEMTFDIEDRFTKDAHIESDFDYDLFEGSSIELDGSFKAQIVTQLPIRFLCSDECKGLCHLCGKNLNEGECDCKEDDIDPRLEKLKKFLDNREVE